MGNQKEKVEEKIAIQKEVENPKEDMSTKEEASKSEPKSEDSVSELEKLRKDLLAQSDAQSKLQKKLNESEKVIEAFKSAFLGEENAETDVVTAETVKSQLDSLKQEIAKRDAEIAKNNYIDSLEEDDSIKVYIKSRVQANTENLEEVVKKEIEDVKSLISRQIPKATDYRPKGNGGQNSNINNMKYILEHPELFKK